MTFLKVFRSFRDSRNHHPPTRDPEERTLQYRRRRRFERLPTPAPQRRRSLPDFQGFPRPSSLSILDFQRVANQAKAHQRRPVDKPHMEDPKASVKGQISENSQIRQQVSRANRPVPAGDRHLVENAPSVKHYVAKNYLHACNLLRCRRFSAPQTAADADQLP